jgi:antitoxin component of RelBE/YafQ-DinJ toxin-antitoxin module
MSPVINPLLTSVVLHRHLPVIDSASSLNRRHILSQLHDRSSNLADTTVQHRTVAVLN